MKIIVDAMGGDNAPLEIVKGVFDSVNEYDCEAVLVGDKEQIERIISENSLKSEKIEIVHADSVITMEDSAGDIMKTKTDSSMSVGLNMLAEGKGDAFMSAGNSGALVVGATLIVKRLKGIKRPAFAAIVPKNTGYVMIIDSGANVSCKPEMLLQFGIMGSIYMNKVMGIENPRVGLANVGTEDHKGGELQHQTFELLKNAPINFVGNVEGRDIPFDACDVVVCDGFTGNLMLKLYEGVAMALMGKIKGVFAKNIKTKLAGAMVYSNLKELKKSVDYNEVGGAPVLGCAKPVFKIHGSAKAKTVKSAFRLTMQYAGENVIDKVSASLKEFSSEE